MIPDLAEALVAGRQAIYFRHFFKVGTNDNRVITDADVEHYANVYRDPATCDRPSRSTAPSRPTSRSTQRAPLPSTSPCCWSAASTSLAR
jgi:hypothetical protein